MIVILNSLSDNSKIKSQSFSGPLSLGCDIHRCFLPLFPFLGDIGLEESGFGEILFSQLIEGSVKFSSPWRVGFCYEEHSRHISQHLLFPLPCHTHEDIFLGSYS